MPQAQTIDDPDIEKRQKVTLVDCDIHPMPVSMDKLMRYVSDEWREHLERYGRRWVLAQYPKLDGAGCRIDAWPANGGLPGSSLELMRSQLLDAYQVNYGILNFDTDERSHPELAADYCRAINDWVAETWLAEEPRLLGSIVVPWEHPALAIREIERRAAERWWAQVAIPWEGLEPLGSRKYWPIYEAAAGLGLPIRMHVGQFGLHNGTGWPSYYIEEHSGGALATRAQLLNMMCEGLFEAVPAVKVIMVEGGVAWAGSLRWALDSAFELFGDEVKLSRKPSEYLDECVWFTTQPFEEPDDPKDVPRAIEHANLASRLMFSTDYPHWDFDSPLQAMPRTIPKETRERIFAGNACDLFGLPR